MQVIVVHAIRQSEGRERVRPQGLAQEELHPDGPHAVPDQACRLAVARDAIGDALLQELAQRLIERVVELHRRRERDGPLFQMLVIGGQVEIDRALLVGHHLLHDVAADHDEADAGKALDALARGADDQPHVGGHEIQLLAGQAADPVHQQDAAGFLGNGPDLLDRIDQAGGGFMVHDGHHLDGLVLPERNGHRLRVKPLIPLAGDVHVLHLVRGGDRGDPLRVHAVLDDEDPASGRQAGGDGRFNGGRAGPGDEDGQVPSRRGERADQLVLNAFDQVVEFGLAMADVRFQQGLAHALGYIHRAGVQQNHDAVPLIAAVRNRSVMAAGSISTRPTSSADSDTFTSRKLGPSSFSMVFAAYTASSNSRTRSTFL